MHIFPKHVTFCNANDASDWACNSNECVIHELPVCIGQLDGTGPLSMAYVLCFDCSIAFMHAVKS